MRYINAVYSHGGAAGARLFDPMCDSRHPSDARHVKMSAKFFTCRPEVEKSLVVLYACGPRSGRLAVPPPVTLETPAVLRLVARAHRVLAEFNGAKYQNWQLNAIKTYVSA
jgi:hypothetical protein